MNPSKPDGASDVAEAITPDLTNADAPHRPSRDGVSAAEARQRLEQYGFNELSEKPRHPLREFFYHFWGPIPWMIEATVWAYALAWFLINDQVKLAAYRILDPDQPMLTTTR